jgi:predicted MFS family arabinose efflux permease
MGQWVAALGVVASGEAAHRLGSRRVLVVWLLLLGPILWMLASVNAVAGAITLALAFSVVAPATFPLVDQILLERVRPDRHGIMSGLRNVATEGSGAIGAAAGGLLLRSWGFGALFGLAGAVSAVAGVVLVALLVFRRAVPNAGRLASAE